MAALPTRNPAWLREAHTAVRRTRKARMAALPTRSPVWLRRVRLAVRLAAHPKAVLPPAAPPRRAVWPSGWRRSAAGFLWSSCGAPGLRVLASGFGRPAGGPGGRPMGGARPQKGPELTPAVEKERVSNYDPNKKNYVRQHDPERVAKNRKQLARETFNGIDDDVVRGGRRARAKKPSAQQMMAPIRIEKSLHDGGNHHREGFDRAHR